MAKIKFKGKSEIVEDGAIPTEAFEKLGVNFDCHTGICGICRVKVIKGKDNLNPKTPAEEDFPLEEDQRLSCQCHQLKGDIEIDFD